MPSLAGGEPASSRTIRAVRRGHGLHHQRDEQSLDRLGIMGNLMIRVRANLGRMLQSIERRLAGERRTVRTFTRERTAENAEHGIVPQLIMVDDVLVAERDAEDALAQHCWKLMDDERRAAAILETRSETRHEADRRIGLTEQQRTCIRGDLAAIERAHNLSPLNGSEIERILATVCRHRG